MASTVSAVWASLGAFFATLHGNLHAALSHLPTPLQPAVNLTAELFNYFQSVTGLSPNLLYITLGTILFFSLIPTLLARSGSNKKSRSMARYGFSRWSVSPFSSQDDGVPQVTDEDFTYITSAELENDGMDIDRRYASQASYDDPYSQSAPSDGFHSQPEDDILHITYNGRTYSEAFPAYCIGDGILKVQDVRDRAAMVLGLSDHQAKRLKLYYKGRKLKSAKKLVREYGVKNNSEILLALGDQPYNPGEGSEESSVVSAGDRYGSTATSPRLDRYSGWDDRSPRSPIDRSSAVGLEVPNDTSRKRGKSKVRTQSPVGSHVSAASAPSASPPVGIPGGPIEKLNAIAAEFHAKYLPKCAEFIARPPKDEKKRIDEHRKLSETVFELVMLKLDGVDTSTENGARARRKELVIEVQGVLNQLDEAKKRG